MIPTRTIQECEHLVNLWNEGKREEVRAAFGGADPSEYFLKTFRGSRATYKPSKSKRAHRRPRINEK